MINIRKCTFETNSSSAHSIVVMRNPSPYSADHDWRIREKMRIWPGDLEFGRGFDVLANWYGRMCYAIASYGESKFVEIQNIICSNIPQITSIILPTDPWGEDDDSLYYGTVDHQSCCLLQNFLETRGISLKDFIFDNRYVVIIDGDEYMLFDTLRRNELINEEGIEEIYG